MYSKTGMTPLITKVVENDLCIACGACVHACPESLIISVYSVSRGAYEVSIPETKGCEGCSKWCEEVCPSVAVNFTNQRNSADITEEESRLGAIRAVKVGYSPSHQFDGVTSSGGVTKALIEDALVRGIPVICLAKDEAGYSAQQIDSVDDAGRIPGSIYHSVSFEKGIELLNKAERSCMVVAIPCVLEGLSKYIAAIDPSLEERIHIRVGLICGWMYSDHSWKSLKYYRKIPGEIRDVRYRGEDKVGRLKMISDAGTYAYSRRTFDGLGEEVQFKTSYSRVFNRLRCRLCENHINQLCDVAIGDAWLKQYPNSNDKLSLVVIRTAKGERELDALEGKGKVVFHYGSVSDIVESQSSNLVFGGQARKYSAYRKSKGRFVPRFAFSSECGEVVVSIYDRYLFAVEEKWRDLVRRKSYRSYYYWMYIKLLPQYVRRRMVQILRVVHGSAK